MKMTLETTGDNPMAMQVPKHRVELTYEGDHQTAEQVVGGFRALMLAWGFAEETVNTYLPED